MQQTKPSKSMKVYGSVLGLAVAAFAVDRWVIGAPADPSQAAASQEYLVGRPAEATATTAATLGVARAPHVALAAQRAAPRPAPAQPLAVRLAAAVETRSAADAEPARDAFRPSAAWVDRKPAALPAEPPTAPPTDPVAEFRARHKLNAVMRTAAGGVAIIDGRTLRPGARVDGFRLARVGLRSASWESADDNGGARTFEMVLEGVQATANAN